MTEKELLQEQINQKKGELSQSRRESESWNSGRKKTLGSNQASKLKVKSLEKEINDLYEQVRLLRK